MRERDYQAYIIRTLRRLFPECVILKNDSSYIQGILDLTVLFGHQWAMLEVKISESSPNQPNQEFYVEKLNGMSFAAFICPENEEEVLDELQRTFGFNRKARLSKS